MRLALLPGLDGTGFPFDPLVACLSGGPPPLIVRYPRSCAGSLSDYVDLAGDALSTGDQWVIVAESFSGPIAARLLAERPDLKINGVVFAASFLSSPRRPLLKLLTCLPLRLVLGMQPPGWAIKAPCLGPGADRDTIAPLPKVLTTAGPDVLAARLRLLADLPASTARITVPCLYIRPTADRLVPRSSMQEIARLTSNMMSREMAGPHFILQASPEHCAGVIKAFSVSLSPARISSGRP